MICFYHAGDFDGKCSAAIVKKKYPECGLYPLNYGTPFPWNEIQYGETVFMVDFSLQPFSDMEKLIKNNAIGKLVWIDHHKSVISDFFKSGLCLDLSVASDGTLRYTDDYSSKVVILKTEFAACELTWKYLFPTDVMPEAVNLLGRYDVWDHYFPEIKRFQWGLRSLPDTDPTNIKIWENLFDSSRGFVKQLITKGSIILDFKALEDAKYLKSFAFETEFNGYSVLAANKGLTNSLLFDSSPKDYDLFVTFAYKHGLWDVFLYSKKDIDVSVIAKKRGGGGHKGASGYQVKHLPTWLTATDRPKKGSRTETKFKKEVTA